MGKKQKKQNDPPKDKSSDDEAFKKMIEESLMRKQNDLFGDLFAKSKPKPLAKKQPSKEQNDQESDISEDSDDDSDAVDHIFNGGDSDNDDHDTNVKQNKITSSSYGNDSSDATVIYDSSDNFRRPMDEIMMDARPSRAKFTSGKVKANKDLALVSDIDTSSSTSGSGKGKEKSGEDEEDAQMKQLDRKLQELINPLGLAGVTGIESKRDIRAPVYFAHDSARAEGKAPKGATPLPKNAPRKMRKGIAKANLERTRRLDERSGVTPNQKVGRRTLTLKERRHLEGKDKRQRGMKGAIGKLTPKGLVISQRDIDRINRSK